MSQALKDAIARLVDKKDLSEAEAATAVSAIMAGEATPAQVAGFAIALRMKGETVPEILGAVRVLREKVTRIDAGDGPVLDTAGTGGDGTGTYNVSTTAAIIAAGAGAKVAKHGNRSVSSRSGSADVLRSLGVEIEAPVPVVERCLKEARIAFLYAPALHPALGHAAAPRRELGVRTLFNLLGPLANPAFADRQVVGVFSEEWVEPLARVLAGLGAEHAWVVHGAGGLDELSLIGPTRVAEVRGGEVRQFAVAPGDAGLKCCDLDDLAGGEIEENAAITRRILDGEEGPRLDLACFNAAAALLVTGIADGLSEGVERAREAVRSGAARETLERWGTLSRQAAGSA